MTQIVLEGPGPFHLGGTQHATAEVTAHEGNGVTITFTVLDPVDQSLKPVNVQVLDKTARELANALIAAVGARPSGGGRL